MRGNDSDLGTCSKCGETNTPIPHGAGLLRICRACYNEEHKKPPPPPPPLPPAPPTRPVQTEVPEHFVLTEAKAMVSLLNVEGQDLTKLRSDISVSEKERAELL